MMTMMSWSWQSLKKPPQLPYKGSPLVNQRQVN